MMKMMKKIFISMSLMLAASALTSCANDDASAITPDAQGVAVNITAALPETRTEIGYVDGAYKVAWKEGDNIYVSAYTDAEQAADAWTWGKPNKTNPPRAYAYTGGAFVTPADAIINPGTYNFTAVYTNASQAKYAAGTNSLDNEQVQDCNAPMAHLATNDCLIGSSKVTIPDAQPSFTMKRIYSWMKILVTNGTGTTATIKNVSFTSTENIAGVFNLDFETGKIGAIAFSPSQSVDVAMTNAKALEVGGSQDAYFVFAPHTANGDVTIMVTMTDGKVYKQTKNIGSKTFEAGKAYTAAITLNANTNMPILFAKWSPDCDKDAAISSIVFPEGLSYDTNIAESAYKCYKGKLGMRATGAAYILHYNQPAATLTFTLQANKASGTGENVFDILGSEDGVYYTMIKAMGNVTKTDTYTIDMTQHSAVRYIKFILTTRANYNYSLYDIELTGAK